MTVQRQGTYTHLTRIRPGSPQRLYKTINAETASKTAMELLYDELFCGAQSGFMVHARVDCLSCAFSDILRLRQGHQQTIKLMRGKTRVVTSMQVS
eukprot:6186777-Pleurochrysis_carterae.AAC.8